MKCSGKCVCGNDCVIDHETVCKCCVCNGVHKRPDVGQRWLFKNGEIQYVAQVVSLAPFRCKVVQVIARPTGARWPRMGQKFEPQLLTVNGPITDPDMPRSRKLNWIYLTGQEVPYGEC